MSRTFFVKHWKSIPRPECCSKILECPVIYLSSTTVEGEQENPRWYMDCEIPYPRNAHKYLPTEEGQISLYLQPIEMINCPFCTKKLPEIELKTTKIPKKIRMITDGGYYCDCCKKRLQNCKCYPSEAKYQIRK